MGTRAVAALLLVTACRAPPVSSMTAADSLNLLRSTAQVARTCLKVVALRDTIDSMRHMRRAEAAHRLPQHVLDSLRNVRWTTP